MKTSIIHKKITRTYTKINSTKKEIKQLRFDMNYDKKLISLSKQLAVGTLKNSKAKLLDKTKIHLQGLQSKFDKTKATLKKLVEVLKKQRKLYKASQKITRKLTNSYFHAKKAILSKNLKKLDIKMLEKKHVCDKNKKLFTPLIKKADKIREELKQRMDKIVKNQENGDPKKVELKLESEQKKLVLSKQSLLMKAQSKKKVLISCEKAIKDLNFKIMKIRYSSYDNILMKKSKRRVKYLYKRIKWRFANRLRYILSKPNWKKNDLAKAMTKVFHNTKKSKCLKGVLLWEEVGREVHKERDNDWKTYFNKKTKGKMIQIFNNQKNKYRKLESLKKSTKLLYIKLRDIEPKDKAKTNEKQLSKKKELYNEKLGKNLLTSDKIREQYEKLLKSSKKKIKQIREKLTKHVIKDAINRRLFMQKIILHRMTHKIDELKKTFHTNHVGYLALRNKYMKLVRYCTLKKNVLKKKCDDVSQKNKLKELSTEKDAKSHTKWKIQFQIFHINHDIIEQQKLTELLKSENFEEDEVKQYQNQLIENFFLQKTDNLPLNYVHDIQRLFLTHNFVKNLFENVAKKKQTLALKKLSDKIESKVKNISLIRKLLEIEQTSKVEKSGSKKDKKTEKDKSVKFIKRLELLEKLNTEKVTLQNQKYSVTLKIEMAPLNDKNMGEKVDRLVKNAAYDTRRKLIQFENKKKYLLLQFSRRQEEYNRKKTKLKNALTSELRAIMRKILNDKQIKLKQAYDDLHKMESKYNILKKRIGSLVNGELARKVLESNQKWMAKLKIMQKRIDRLRKNLEKESKVLGLRSWNYARYTNDKIMKKYPSKDKKQKPTAKNTKAMNKQILTSMAKIKNMKARLVDMLNKRKYYQNLYNNETSKLVDVIKTRYKIDVEQEMKNRRVCMKNVSKSIAKDMKAKTKNVHN